MRRQTVISGAATFVTLLVIGGCAGGPTATELDHGNSVRHMLQAQSLNPAASDNAAVDATDSERIRNALDVYRTDVSLPQNGVTVNSDGSSQQ